MKILRAFIAGVRAFVIPWNQPYIPPVRKPQSIDRYFARAERYLATGGKRIS